MLYEVITYISKRIAYDVIGMLRFVYRLLNRYVAPRIYNTFAFIRSVATIHYDLVLKHSP